MFHPEPDCGDSSACTEYARPRRTAECAPAFPPYVCCSTPRCSSSALGVAEAISRLGTDVGVDEPAPQDALALETGFFHDTGRGRVLHVADRADPPDVAFAHSPAG